MEPIDQIAVVFFLWTSLLTATYFVFSRYTRIGVVTLAWAGLLAYSIPALIGVSVSLPRPGMPAGMYPASLDAVTAVGLSLAGFGIMVLIASVTFAKPKLRCRTEPLTRDDQGFVIAAIVVVVALYAFLSALMGWSFFLDGRHKVEAEGGIALIFWRWAVAFGLLASIRSKKIAPIAFFALMLALVAVSGDRTVPVITAVASLLLVLYDRRVLSVLLSPVPWVAIPALGASIFLIKPLYISIKNGQSFGSVWSSIKPSSILFQWEAFVTHELLERVLASGFRYSYETMLLLSGGQLLVVPSAFGLNSAQFNTEIQAQLFPDLTYGVAYSYLAQWVSMFHLPGAFVAGALFAAVIGLLHRWLTVASSRWFLLALMLGSVTAIYAHRNSVENLLAVWRQAAIVFAIILIVQQGWKLLRWSLSTPSRTPTTIEQSV
ncbi:hypothetical protein N8D56_21200 [Devosia sp. A8/3-2]|nr:hypothetical protein N8D56_21200 [Devosia sp. A8/3-2]